MYSEYLWFNDLIINDILTDQNKDLSERVIYMYLTITFDVKADC